MYPGTYAGRRLCSLRLLPCRVRSCGMPSSNSPIHNTLVSNPSSQYTLLWIPKQPNRCRPVRFVEANTLHPIPHVCLCLFPPFFCLKWLNCALRAIWSPCLLSFRRATFFLLRRYTKRVGQQQPCVSDSTRYRGIFQEAGSEMLAVSDKEEGSITESIFFVRVFLFLFIEHHFHSPA